jgi:branched-chain amino acid transport system ATP-binding protein
MLETRELTIRFGGHVAVDRVSCEFAPGTLTAIVGPNGAGKTTYFNLISGQLKASAGSVWLDGIDITGRDGLGPHPSRARPRVPADAAVSESQRARERAPRGAVAPP